MKLKVAFATYPFGRRVQTKTFKRFRPCRGSYSDSVAGRLIKILQRPIRCHSCRGNSMFGSTPTRRGACLQSTKDRADSFPLSVRLKKLDLNQEESKSEYKTSLSQQFCRFTFYTPSPTSFDASQRRLPKAHDAFLAGQPSFREETGTL